MSSFYMHSWPGFEGAAEPHPPCLTPSYCPKPSSEGEKRDRGKGVSSQVTIPIPCGQDTVLQGVLGQGSCSGPACLEHARQGSNPGPLPWLWMWASHLTPARSPVLRDDTWGDCMRQVCALQPQ